MGVRELVQKYSTSGPRYTSYPTAPQWTESLKESSYFDALKANLSTGNEPLALYIHIPFCEALCYYCGCNIQITKDHSRSEVYLNALIKEIETIAATIPKRRALSQISWGGGTPTFLTPPQIEKLHAATKSAFDIAEGAEVSIEIDPRVTSEEHLRTLARIGFNRVSLGVQDFDERVQKTINRIQTVEMTGAMLKLCRNLGFQGINFDLIYGLPFQSLESFERTLATVLSLRPDRIALYNYAHLPSLRPHQKILEKFERPDADARLSIFNESFDRFTEAGYRAIGMDHFALQEDELSRALDRGTLYRNFMGYTVKRGAGMIGIGASAIGEIGGSYFQNIRETKPYEDSIEAKGFATFRGCLLNPDDVRRKWVIQQLMCKFVLNFAEYEERFGEKFETYFSNELKQIEGFYSDAILTPGTQSISVTALGRLFVRNVAMAFDAYLKAPTGATYSKTL